MPRPIKTSLVVQALFLVFWFGVYWFTECTANSDESSLGDAVAFYFGGLPLFWDGIPASMVVYLVLAVVALLALGLSFRRSFRRWALPGFNFAAACWSLLPYLNMRIGDYNGP